MSRQDSLVKLPTCSGCDAAYLHTGRTEERDGVLMHPYDRYCLGGKRPRRFRPSDTTRKPPKWCPRRKSPCEVRVYGFVSDDEREMHYFFARLRGERTPNESSYGLRCQTTTKLSPKAFWRGVMEGKTAKELLALDVALYEVVEIDDGIKPVCFYHTCKGYRVEPLFKTESACERTAVPEVTAHDG